MPGRVLTARLQIAWDGSSYTDESSNLIGASGAARLVAPGSDLVSGRGITDTMRVELRNASRRYSPLNASSPLYASIASGGAYLRPCRFDVAVDGGAWTRVFTGVIKLPQEQGGTASDGPTVTIECRSRDELLLNRRVSTPLATFESLQGATEQDVIEQWLTDAGFSGGDWSLDAGLFSIPWAWLDDDSVLEDCWQVAGACGGRFYAAADGTFRYENAQHWLNHTTAVATLGPGQTYGYQRLNPRYRDDDLYSSITVEASVRQPVAAGVLWQPAEPVVVSAGASKTITAQFRQPAYTVTALSYTPTTTGGSAVSTSYITVTATYYAQRATLVIANTAALAVELKGLTIQGRPLQGGPRVEETQTSAAAFWTGRGTRSRRVASNYVQTPAQAGMLAALLRDWSQTPRLSYQVEGAVGNPALRVGDRITLNDTAVLGGSRDALVTSIGWRYGANGFWQDLEATDAASIYPYTKTQYFVLGTDTLGAASDKVFY